MSEKKILNLIEAKMTNTICLFSTISLMVLVSTAADDTQQQQAESSGLRANPEVSEFIRRLVHSARRKRSLAVFADEAFSGLDERTLLEARHREAVMRHQAALERREREEDEMSDLAEGENDEETEGLEDEDLDERDDDDGLSEAENEELEDRMDAHNKAHAKLKKIHKAMKSQKAQMGEQTMKAPLQMQEKKQKQGKKQNRKRKQKQTPGKKQIPQAKMEEQAKMDKRQIIKQHGPYIG